MSLWTERERQVIALVQEGHSYQKIADELGVSRSTVSSYVSRVGRLLPGRKSPLRKILDLDEDALREISTA